MSPVEKQHIISAFCFEVGKVKSKDVQRQVVDVFSNVDADLAEEIAKGVGVAAPAKRKASKEIITSPALSQARTVKAASTRKVAVLAGNGFHEKELQTVLEALKQEGITVDIISQNLGYMTSGSGQQLEANGTFLTVDSVLYDAVYAAGGLELKDNKQAMAFIREAYNHYKAIGAANEGIDLLQSSVGTTEGPGIVTAKDEPDYTAFSKAFIDAVAAHRHWDRRI